MTFAVFLLGGEAKPVDLEDIAMKANEIAPGRFAWRKYPSQINIKNVDAFLWDAKKPKNGNYVLNSGKDEWVLTPVGVVFARERIAALRGVDVSRKALSAKDKNWMRSERERMLGSPAFAKFRAGELDGVSEQEAEAFFRLDSYVTGRAREQKLLRLINVFGEDPELGEAVKALEMKVRRN
ncbi:MAG: hypothetical protein HY735_02155 [Verrucomicrobia bacterium]|nr:hypothetical protein [Verrucomicrobiota bacterium]